MATIGLVLKKELIEFRRDRLLLAAWIAGALIVGGFAAGMSLYAGSSPEAAREILEGERNFREPIEAWPGVARQALDQVLNHVVPMVCAFIALAAGLFGGSSSMISEREGRTLETLLGQPLKETEILAGKILSTVIVSTTGILAAQIMIFLAGFPAWHTHLPAWPGVRYAAVMLVEVPLLAGLGTTVAVVIALRVDSSRATLALSGLTSIVLVSLTSPLVMLSLLRGDLLAVVCGGLLLVNLALFALAARRFQREKVLRGQA